jgi:DNA modification methylase
MSEHAVPTPKHGTDSLTGQAGFYPYYAGFSGRFARSMLKSLSAQSDGTVFDPWNGAGTTTAACAELGLSAIGRDLNPVMVVVAKGRLLSSKTAGSVAPLRKV